MGLIKKGAAATAVAEAPKTEKAAVKVDGGTAAAVGRLKKSTETAVVAQSTEPTADKKYADRDFAEEARGKTRCVQFEAALMSPAIAGMKWDTIEQYLALVKQAAEAGVAYTFGDNK